MDKIYKNYAWKDRNLQMPTIARGRYIRLGEGDRSLNTIQVKLPFWVLDCSFVSPINYKVDVPLGKWHQRASNTLHLYPANMLQQGESLGVIAEHTGFSSPFHLSLMFKKTIGMTPWDYRRKLN